MCYLEITRDPETFKRYPPDGFLTTEHSDHDVDLDPAIIDPDPFTSDDCLNVFSPIHQFLLTKPEEKSKMNVEDEPSSGLNGRLRPRRSATHSHQLKDARKSEGKYFHEKSKKSNTQSKASPNKPDDLQDKSDSSPALSFLCPYCDKKFVSKQTVSKHSRRMHLSTSKQNLFIGCLFCNHTESEPNNIIRHMVDSHPNQYFACFDCNTRFSSTSELAEHKLNVCEKQKPYRSKLRQKTSSVNKIPKNLNLNCKSGFRANCKEYSTETGYNGIVISCELKPAQMRDTADIEDNITTNLILPSNKNIGNNSVLEKNAVIVLDDIQWNKRLPPNFTFHNTDADQILSRLGVIHRTPRTGEGTKRDWLKSFEDSSQKFEKCFDTSFYAQVASNVQENLAKFLDGSFNFNPDVENVIKTRKAKNSVIINTVEGFPILLNCEQYSRNVFDSYLPRTLAPKHKCKWGSLENDKIVINPDQLKRDSHINNCIITLVSSLDIWTQLCMRRKYEDKFCQSPVEKKTEKRNLIDKELKEILESRELPVTSSQVVKYVDEPAPSGLSLDFPFSLGLTPSAPQYQIQPAVLSGEWVRPRCYVCCACGAQTRDARALTSHISTQHPNAQVQHYEIVGESLLNADILKHLYVPPSQPTNRTRPLRGFRECTKCKVPASLEELHQHMLDCAGDTPTVRRKCRYRPFGVRRRRPRLPDNTIRKKIRKDIRNRQNQKGYMRPRARPRIKTEVGDAETIRKMLADLPAKRHRVVINPVNSILRPRRKFDLQRNTILIKRRPSDDPKKRELRTKDISHSRNIGEPTQKKMTSRENTKPMRAKMKPMASKSCGQNESFKRSKRTVKEANSDGEENDLAESADDDPPTELPSPEGKPSDEPSNQEASDSPEKIDVNEGPYKTREQSGDHKGANSGSSGPYPKGGQSDSGGSGDNPVGGGNDPNGNRSNNNNGSPSDSRENGDKLPVQNTPLKHSIARLTANSETHDKSVQFHHLFLVQQECNNVTEHAPTGQRELFENEAVVTKLDKPPLHYPKGALEPYTLQKGKLNKPRKGLNDCIAMLKNKLVDPPSLPAIGQVSVQCGDDEPIEPIHYTPTTIFESGINMTPAEIFYRPILPQGPMLSNRCNTENLVSYPYPTAQTMVTATRAEKPKVRQKKCSQSSNRSLPKQKQDEYLIKRTSTRVKSLTRAEIKMHHELMRLPPQIEIIPQQSSNVHCNDSYQTGESVVMLNQKKNTDSVNQKRRASVDVQILHRGTKKNSVIVPSTTTITFDSQCQMNRSYVETIKDKSPNCIVNNSQINSMQALVIDSTTLKPPKEKSQCDTLIITEDIYSESNYNDMSPSIPPAHSSTTVESILSIPLDLSGKSVSVNQLEQTLQGDDSCYNTNYDSYGTLDLSNKRPDYLIVTTEDAVIDFVVDLSIKSVDQKQTNSNVYLNLSADIPDILTDLSTSRCEIDNFPKDLSMKVNDNSCQDSLGNLGYEVEDLSGSKGPVAGEKRLRYYSSGVSDIDKDIPTDLSDKRNMEIVNRPQLPSISGKNDGVKFFLDLTQNNDLPADLSAKNSNEKHTILPSDLDVVPNMRMESTQDTNVNPSSSSIADKSQEITMKSMHDTLSTIAQYKVRDSSASEGMVVVDILENSDTNLHPLKPPCTAVQLGSVQSYEPIFNYSNIVMQEIHSSAELSVSSQDQSSYEDTPSHVNVTTSAIRGNIPLYTLPNSIQPNPLGKVECTKPVYTLANSCISTTKIETLNENTLSNTLLSVPGTTFANTTPVYTLAGTSVGKHINFGNVPYTINEISPIIDNNILCHSSLSPSHDVNRDIDHYNLSSEVEKGTQFSTKVGSEIEKGVNVATEVEGLEKGTKNTYCTIAADLDPDAISKIAKLPKEIVEILGTMPVDHRKQLLNILPHYVTTSTSNLNIQDTNARPESSSLPNIACSKKTSYLQVQTADSTSGSKNFNNMKMEDEFQENLHKCQNAINSDIRLIPLPPSPQPSLTCEIFPNDTTVIVQSEQINLHNTITNENDCCDIKTIDLTQDDNVDLLGYTNNKGDDVDQTTIVTASEKKDIIVSKANKHKINDQTASLRAVRIKTPSERLKVVSAENQLLLKNQIEVSKQNASFEENKVDKQLTIKTAAVNIKVTGESHSTVISQVDFESNNKKLKDESTKKSPEYITIKIDVDQDTQNDHVINSGLNSTIQKTNDINCTHSNKTHMNLDSVNETIKNASQIEINGVCPTKNNDTTESADKDVTKSNNKKKINNDNNDNTWVNSSVANEKEISDDDDSEDDILLAVIVKQKREKQNINKIEKDPKYHELIGASTTCNEIKIQTEEQHVTPLITSCKSNEEEFQELETEESVNVSTANSNETSMKHLEDEQKNLNKLACDTNNDIQSTIHQIEKVDMGVQYECISKELENDSIFIVTNTNTGTLKNSDKEIVQLNKHQMRPGNVVDKKNTYKNNAEDLDLIQDVRGNTIDCADTQNENSTFRYASNDNSKIDRENLETTSEIRVSDASDKQNIICPGVEECIIFDDKKESKESQNSACTKQLKNIDGEKHNIAIELSLASEIEERTKIPLRRSRRGKSMFVNRNVTFAYDDDNATNADVLLQQKTPLTKKQLIFSKLLLDEENHSDIPIRSIPEKSHNIGKDCVNNPENSIAEIGIQNLNSISEIDVNKSKKRAKSAQLARKIKKKKLLEKIDISDTDECLQSTKVSEAESNYSTKIIAIEENINSYGKSNTVSIESKQDCKSDQQIELSFIKADSRLKSAEVTDITITECTSTTPAISEVVCNAVNTCQEALISTETQKLITPTINTDLVIYSRSKRTKSKLKNAAAKSAFIQHDGSKEDSRIVHKNKTFNNAEPRTTCYNRPVASKRTRSKSTIVKTTEKELSYDPYDIDLDDMIANAEPTERKRVKSERVILTNQEHILTELPSTSTPKEIKKRDVSPVIRRKVKKSIKHRDRLRRQKRIKDTSDSDDSSKSDIPLTKYVKNREKRAKQSYDDLSDRDDYDIDFSDDSSNDKKNRADCRNKKRTLTKRNNADTSSSHDETEERLKSEQFMESFGFFSERKPRKSNLIAAKKISETFHVIANESEDVYVGYRERAIKRALQSDGKKAKDGECSRAQGPSNARKKTRRAARKKKICTQILRYLCSICKKEFRRPDNYLRHQLTLLHISRLSEALKIKINPILEEPNYLIIYKQHIDRLKIITDKLAKKKKNSKSLSKIILPTLTEILLEVNRVVREQILSRRGLSRDEALFLDCCELLKESRRNDGDPNNMMNSNYRCPQATMTGLALIEKQIDDDKSDCKSDGEVDSITAKNILESEEVRNLENDLISGLKEAANANNAHNINCLSYQNADDNARMDPNDTANESFPNPNHFGQTTDKFENVKELRANKVKKPEVKRMMYPDIIEDIDMYEDKFDKIKRKCRSQAAAAKQIQNVVESNTSQKMRKKTDKKKIRRNSKKKHLSTQVPTKGALKGFDIVKVSTSQPEPDEFTNSHERSKKKKKKSGSKKKKEKKDSELSNKKETDNHIKDTTTTAHKKIDVYEFMDNEDAELFEFRPSTLMERFKSINNKAVPSTSKLTPQDDPENSSGTVSDGDDFVYISDDYVGTDDETENSMSCEQANAKPTNEAKKTVSPLKRKDAIEKNTVMGKIFKNNAVRTEKKLIKNKEISNPKANMDQLFDSLLENGPSRSEISKPSKLPERCPKNVSTTASEETPHSSPNKVLSPTKSLKDYDLTSSEACTSASKRCNEYIDNNTPSTSKKLDEFSITESKNCIVKSKNYKEISPKKDLDIIQSNRQDAVKSNTQTLSSYHERLSNSDNFPPINLNSQENYKIKSPLKNPDEGIGTNYDFSAELLDHLSHDDTGVAKQRARRKCTVGKQKVLAETWSSESEPDGAPPRPNSAESKESDSARKRRGKKKEGHYSSGRRGNNRSISFKKHDESRVSSCNRKELSNHGEPSREIENTSISRGGIKWIHDYRARDQGPSYSGVGPHKPVSSVCLSNPSALSTSKVRPRPSSYYWSSDGDDEQEHPQQHGWIVGDSHKKLVTMLAHAKGRKRNNDDKRHLVE